MTSIDAPHSPSDLEDLKVENVALSEVSTYEALARLIGVDPNDSLGSLSGDSEERSDHRSHASLSLTSVMRAEKMLDKTLPLVHGGTHVEFTKADLERIRDPEVLQFLQDNSKMFKKYEKANAEPTSAPQSGGKVVSAAEMEAAIEAFQQQLDTFITAVDEDGREYTIELDEKGTLQVPVEDDLPFGEDDEDEGYDTPDSRPSSPPTETEESPRIAVKAKEAEDMLDEESGDAVHSSLPRSVTLEETPQPSPPKKAKRKRQHEVKHRSKPSRIPVRQVRTFLPEEEERVDELLAASRADLERNPFHLPSDRVKEIDVSLSKYRKLRGPSPRREPLKVLDTFDDNRSSQKSQRAPNALGNRYLEEMKKQQRFNGMMRSVNAALAKTQKEMELLELMTDTSDELLAARPSWARDVTLASEEEVRAEIERARAEEQKAKEMGLHVDVPTRDPYASLIQNIREVSSRAEGLLQGLTPIQHSSPPLLEDSIASSEELGDVPENIRDDMMDMV